MAEDSEKEYSIVCPGSGDFEQHTEMCEGCDRPSIVFNLTSAQKESLKEQPLVNQYLLEINGCEAYHELSVSKEGVILFEPYMDHSRSSCPVTGVTI